MPLVFEVRDLWPELPIAIGKLKNPLSKGFARWMERLIYDKSSHMVGLSPGICSGIEQAGKPMEKITCVPNSCDFELFEVPDETGRRIRGDHEWLQARPMALYAGTLGEMNAVGWLARVADHALKLDPEVRLVVIGDGKEGDAIRKLAAELGVLDRNFFMIESIPKNKIPAWFNAADIALSVFKDVKEMWNNSANKFFDSLAAGRPIAVNYGGWTAELIQKNDCGLRIDVNDPSGAAEILVEKLKDKKWLEGAGERARRLGRERFDRNILAGELEKVLAAAAAESRAPRHG